MGNKASRDITSEDDTRGGSGCFGWVSKAFRRKKRGRRLKGKQHQPAAMTPLASDDERIQYSEESIESHAKEEQHKKSIQNTAQQEESQEKVENAIEEHDDSTENTGFEEMNEVNSAVAEEQEDGGAEGCSAAPAAGEGAGEERQKVEERVAQEQEPQVVMTWAEEVDDAEEKGLDVFAPLTDCLPRAAFVHSVTSDSAANDQAPAAAASNAKMGACQRRRARRRAVAAARNESAAREAAATPDETHASVQHEATAATVPPADTTDETTVPDTTPADTTTTAPRSGTRATRQRRARRRALGERMKGEARLAQRQE